MVAIPCTSAWYTRPESLRELPECEFMFLANKVAYYKTPLMHQLGASLGDIKLDIIDRESVIMHRLQEAIVAQSLCLLEAVSAAAKLDWCAPALINCVETRS